MLGFRSIPLPGDDHCGGPSDTETMKIKATRTNEKPTEYRAVDLPTFDVYGDGQLIGTVRAYTTREYNHYSAGSVRRFAARDARGRSISNGYTNKRDAVAAVAAKAEEAV